MSFLRKLATSMFGPIYKKPSKVLNSDQIWRFLLSESKWRLSVYEERPSDAIQNSIADLDKRSPHVSVFRAIAGKQNFSGRNQIQYVAFIFAAIIRSAPQDLCYMDFDATELEALGLKIRLNEKTSAINDSNISCLHYEIKMSDAQKTLVAKAIFEKIKNLPDKKLPRITKQELHAIKKEFHSDQSYALFDKAEFNQWALQN